MERALNFLRTKTSNPSSVYKLPKISDNQRSNTQLLCPDKAPGAILTSVRGHIVSSDIYPPPPRPKRTVSTSSAQLIKRVHERLASAHKQEKTAQTKPNERLQPCETPALQSTIPKPPFANQLHKNAPATTLIPKENKLGENKPKSLEIVNVEGKKTVHALKNASTQQRKTGIKTSQASILQNKTKPSEDKEGAKTKFSYQPKNKPPNKQSSPKNNLSQKPIEKIQKSYEKQVSTFREETPARRNDMKTLAVTNTAGKTMRNKSKPKPVETKLSLLKKHSFQEVPEPPKETPVEIKPSPPPTVTLNEFVGFGTSDLNYLEKKGIELFAVNLNEKPKIKPVAKVPIIPTSKPRKVDTVDAPSLRQEIGQYLSGQVHAGVKPRPKPVTRDGTEFRAPRKIEALFHRPNQDDSKVNLRVGNYMRARTGVTGNKGADKEGTSLWKARAGKTKEEDFRKNVWDLSLEGDARIWSKAGNTEEKKEGTLSDKIEKDISAQFEKYIPSRPIGLRLKYKAEPRPDNLTAPSVRNLLKNFVPYNTERNQVPTNPETDQKPPRLVNIIKMSSDIVNRSKNFLNTSNLITGLLSTKIKTIDK